MRKWTLKWIMIVPCVCSSILIGCTNTKMSEMNVFRDRSNDYKKSRVYPIIEVPKGVAAEPFSDMYDIPK